MLPISNFISLWLKYIFCMITIILNLLSSFYGLAFDQSWRIFHVYVKSMWIKLFGGELFFNFLFIFKICFKALLKSCISLLIFYIAVLSVIENGLLRSPTINVELSSPSFDYIFAVFETLPLVVYMFISVVSWWIHPFIITKYYSSSQLAFFKTLTCLLIL